ncbi:MAG: Endothelin-converting enzyme, partial [Bacteroidota bacterium]
MKKVCVFFLTFGISSLIANAQTPSKFIDRANMNLSVKPGDDFVEYSNGIWTKNNPIPAKETRWGSFNQLRDFNINAVKSILEKSQMHKAHYPSGSVEKRVADFYAAAMDSLTIENLGYTPIKPDLDKIAAIASKNEIYQAIASFRTQGLGSPFYGFYVGQDRKNINKMVPQLSQGGTSLPDRDYYLKSDARSARIQEAFKKYVKTLFELTGSSSEAAQKNAESIF